MLRHCCQTVVLLALLFSSFANPRLKICDVNYSRAKELADLYSCKSFASLREVNNCLSYKALSRMCFLRVPSKCEV